MVTARSIVAVLPPDRSFEGLSHRGRPPVPQGAELGKPW
jgi:hypothetical protein